MLHRNQIGQGNIFNIVDFLIRSKGFGFITFKNPDDLDEIQKNRPHEVDSRKIETKRATPKQVSVELKRFLFVINTGTLHAC